MLLCPSHPFWYLLPYLFSLNPSIGNTIRDLYGSNTVDFNYMADAWKVRGLSKGSTGVGSCNGLILGGSGNIEQVGSFKRKYTDTLPTHDYLVFDIGVKFIGTWKGTEDAITLIVDGNGVKEFYIKTVGATDAVTGCTKNGKDVYARLVGKVPHKKSTVTVQIEWAIFSSETSSFGIYDLSLTAHNGVTGDAASAYLTLADSTLTAYGYGTYSDTAKTSCKSGYYLDSTACKKCDPSCLDCSGSSSAQCYQCAEGYSYVSGKCIKCTGNCDECSGNGAKNCLLCDSGYTLDFDGSCNKKSSCNSSPYVVKHNTDSAISICGAACTGNQYMFWNFTCGTCDSGLVKSSTKTGGNKCTYPCSSSQYLLEDGTCVDICEYSARSEEGYKFCTKADPCENGYIYEDGTCDSECPAPYELVLGGADNSTMYCNTPCATGEFYAGESRGSPICVDSCEVDQIRYVDDIMYCTTNTTCPSVFDFLYENKSCISSCPSPYVGSFDNDARTCNFPCKTNQYVKIGLGTCIDTCDTKTNQIIDVNGVKVCQLIPTKDPIVTTKPDSARKYATLGMMMRYNIGLENFRSSVGIGKFQALIANLLGLSSPNLCRILRMYEGSTVIEAEVIIYTDEGAQAVKFTNLKVKNMQSILEAAAASGQLDLEGVTVLDYKVTSSTVVEETAAPTSVSKLAIGLGVGLTCLGLIVVGFVGYRLHMRNKLKAKSGSNYRTTDFEEDDKFVKNHAKSPKTPKTAKTPSEFSPISKIDPEASVDLALPTEMFPINVDTATNKKYRDMTSPKFNAGSP